MEKLYKYLEDDRRIGFSLCAFTSEEKINDFLEKEKIDYLIVSGVSYMKAMVSPAITMLTIDINLMRIFKDGPEVSLNGSPTVSPTIHALWAKDPLPPKAPSSIFFLALSHAPPAFAIKTAKVKLTKSEKKELNDSIRARARQRALEKEVDRQYRKLERQKMKEIPVSEEDVVYLFGVGTNFNDSTVYLTDIIPVHNLQIQKKTHFLPHRTEFSLQLREYLEGQLGLAHETTAIFFADKRKKIAKNYYKLKKRYLDEGYSSLIVIDPEKFSFKLLQNAVVKATKSE